MKRAEFMTVRDLLSCEIDIDVYDDVCEEIGIAFCGPVELTAEGECRFAYALSLPVEVREDCAILLLNDRADWRKALKASKTLFEALAGYCADSDFDKWFILP